jgi:hypothetical protein
LFFDPPGGRRVVDGGVELALFVIQVAASENAVWGTVTQALEALVIAEGISEEKARRRLWPPVRDILSGPPLSITFVPEWRTTTAVQLAQGMYESRDFSAMPILADALQEAGCDNDDVLNHCRDPKATHVRGCWVVDLVLGKS